MTKLPIGRDPVPRGGGPSVASGDPERKGLADQHCVRLPVLAPVPAHAHPVRSGPFYAHPHDVTRSCDVGDQDKVEVAETVDREPYPALLPAWHPA